MKFVRLRVQVLLLLTILVAAFFRFYRLWELPPGLFFDEAFNGFDALRVLRAGYLTPFFPENNGREALFIYL